MGFEGFSSYSKSLSYLSALDSNLDIEALHIETSSPFKIASYYLSDTNLKPPGARLVVLYSSSEIPGAGSS